MVGPLWKLLIRHLWTARVTVITCWISMPRRPGWVMPTVPTELVRRQDNIPKPLVVGIRCRKLLYLQALSYPTGDVQRPPLLFWLTFIIKTAPDPPGLML